MTPDNVITSQNKFRDPNQQSCSLGWGMYVSMPRLSPKALCGLRKGETCSETLEVMGMNPTKLSAWHNAKWAGTHVTQRVGFAMRKRRPHRAFSFRVLERSLLNCKAKETVKVRGFWTHDSWELIQYQTHNQTKVPRVISPQPRLGAHSMPETAQLRFKSTRVFLLYELFSALTTTRWFATCPSPHHKPLIFSHHRSLARIKSVCLCVRPLN